MAAVTSSASPTTSNGALQPANKHQNGRSNGDTTNMQPSVLHDPTMFYVPTGYPHAAYYYGGFSGSGNEWDDYSRYVNHDGMEGTYGDMFHPYSYAPFTAYHSDGASVPPIGHDGQLYAQQQYQYPTFFQPPTPSDTPQPSQPPTSLGVVSTSTATTQLPISIGTDRVNPKGVAKSDSNGKNELATSGPGRPNPSVTSNVSNGHKDTSGSAPPTASKNSRFGFDQMLSALPQFDVQHRPASSASLSSIVSHNATGTRSQNSKSQQQLAGIHDPRPTFAVAPTSPAYVNRMYPSSPVYGHNGNPFGFGFGANGYYGSRPNRRWGQYADNKNFRGQSIGYHSNGNENLEGLNELSKGPRYNNFKTKAKDEKVQNSLPAGKEDTSLAADREKYNGSDFPVDYKDAMFFIIKSYSEDDIHKSIKYNVWASTPNGNKKLNAAFQEAQEKRNGCPIFLFFSVNTSGQFVGVATMVGPVDFDKTVNYWQQDKWTGCFPVKWHIIKDLPNSYLKHITLENNENKPVTNSRDTQEVKLEQGLQMLKIFKDHAGRTSVLDDFEFYNNREKLMLEKRAKHQYKKVLDGRISDTGSSKKDRDVSNQKPLESVSISSINTPKGGSVEQSKPNEIVAAPSSIEVSKDTKPADEK